MQGLLLKQEFCAGLARQLAHHELTDSHRGQDCARSSDAEDVICLQEFDFAAETTGFADLYESKLGETYQLHMKQRCSDLNQATFRASLARLVIFGTEEPAARTRD